MSDGFTNEFGDLVPPEMSEEQIGPDPSAEPSVPVPTVTPIEEERTTEYGAIPWEDVRKKPEFQSLPESTKARAAFQYFDEVVAPKIQEVDPDVDYDTARSEFLNYNSQLTLNETVPTLTGDLVRTVGKTGSKILGTTLGFLNSPLAFVWGTMNAPNVAPEEYNKLSAAEKVLVGLGGGFESAGRSITKEGDWGTLYNDYYKGIVGKTIEEDLPENMKWSAPALETMANLISDPLMFSTFAGAARAARASKAVKSTNFVDKVFEHFIPDKLPKYWQGEIPESVIKTINELDALDVKDQKELLNQLTGILKHREGYLTQKGTNEELLKKTLDIFDYGRAPNKLTQIYDMFEGTGPSVKTAKTDALKAVQDVKDGEAMAKKVIDMWAEKMTPVQREAFTKQVIDIWNNHPNTHLSMLDKEARKSPIMRDGFVPDLTPSPYKHTLDDRNPFEELFKRQAGESDTGKRSSGFKNFVANMSDDVKNVFGKVLDAEDRLYYSWNKLTDDLDKRIDDSLYNYLNITFRRETPKTPNIKLTANQLDEYFKTLDTRDVITDARDSKMVEINKLENDWLKVMEKLDYFKLDSSSLLDKEQALLNGWLNRSHELRKSSVLGDIPSMVDDIKLFEKQRALERLANNGLVDSKTFITAQKALNEEAKRIETRKSGRKFVSMGVPEGMENIPEVVKLYNSIGKEEKAFAHPSGIWNAIKEGWSERITDRFKKLKMEGLDETYQDARTFESYKGQAALEYEELRKAMVQSPSVKNEGKLFDGYVAAHRMLERSERGIANPGGTTAKDARKVIKSIEDKFALEGGNVNDLKNNLQTFYNWSNKYILKEVYDNGIISKESYEAILKNNEHYATFEVLEYIPDNIKNIPSLPSKEYFSVGNQNIIKGMTGTEKAISNPVEATMRKFLNAKVTFARNKVASVFVDEALTSTDFPIQKVADSQKEFAILKNTGENTVMRGTWNVNEFDTVSRFKDGNLETYLVPKDIADTLKHINMWQAPAIVKMVSSIFRAAATGKNLGFMVGNAARDFAMYYVTSASNRGSSIFGQAQKDWIKGAAEGIKKEFGSGSEMIDNYVRAGGSTMSAGAEMFEDMGKSYMRAPLFKGSNTQQAIHVIREYNPLALIEKINNVVEAAPRMGTFDRMIQLGHTPEDAAMAARVATIDFDRGGTWTKVANQFIPFLNARVQARVSMVEGFQNNLVGTTIKAVTSTMPAGLGLYAYNRLYCDKEYDMIPDYIKDDNFVFITGMTTDKKTGKEVPEYFVVAKGDVGKTIWNPIEFAIDQAMNKNPRSTKDFLVETLGDLSPVDFASKGKLDMFKILGGFTPQVAKGFVEDFANKNFYTGRDIIGGSLKNKPPELQYREDTPDIYKALGRKIGVSPLKLQNYAANIFASYGREGQLIVSYDEKGDFPISITPYLEGLKGKIIKSKGDNILNKALVSQKGMSDGFNTAKAYAIEAVKVGNNEDATTIMISWNEGLDSQINAFEDEYYSYGINARSKLKHDYMFTADKIRNVLKYKEKEPLTVESAFKPKRR